MLQNFTIVKRGYDPNEVDEYIKALENQINEYKEKSSAINKAIINAQLAADNIINAAHEQTKKILLEAERDASEMRQKTINKVSSLKINIANQRNLWESFQKDYNAILDKYLKPFDASDMEPVFSKLGELDRLINDFSTPYYEFKSEMGNKKISSLNNENIQTIDSEKEQVPLIREKSTSSNGFDESPLSKVEYEELSMLLSPSKLKNN